MDSFQLFSTDKTIKTKVSKEIYEKIKHDADYLNVGVDELLIIMINNFYER
ncbi:MULTISPECIES: hypothetical protein [Pseudomonadati]|uniref:Uncharacterized protein n=1 Tax=Shewanella aestuarii TaxID=1028752 RepID=A0ABT0L3N0_9GAMM|nr:hypothetical protein [Shewanella aestuarii]MCL1118329.1 hypothetical protein [Shewanella aestuarii]GGN80550.1 hypothetical protein GCM10009193_25850 [Shewanella aestuarii]